MKPVTLLFFLILAVLVSCNGNNKNNQAESLKKPITTKAIVDISTEKPKQDSLELTKLVRSMYKWYDSTPKVEGFTGVKKNETDTLYTSIDLTENDRAIEALKKTGFFAADFLAEYRAIAIRMDKELRNGSSLWPEGELSTFTDDVNEWCNCQDYPDNYWEKLTLTNIKYNKDMAIFKWTWGDKFFYDVKAKKENGMWKISYLQGFDMSYYDWEWVKKHK